MKCLLYVSLLLALGACGNSDKKNVSHLVFNDFEGLDGWSSCQPNSSLTKEKAHSGLYAIKVDPAIEYSLGYINTLNRLGNTRADVNKMSLHGWAFVPGNTDHPQVVLELLNLTDGKTLQHDVVELHEVAAAKGYGKWIEFEHPVTIPANIPAFSQVKLYLWRASSANASYVDDLALDKVP